MYTIYRVENSLDKMGPYSGSWDQVGKFPSRIGLQTLYKVVKGTDWGHQGPEHPSNEEDIPDSRWLQRNGVFALCAFPDKKSIIKWFTPEELRYLIKNNYRVRKFKVRDIIMGTSGKQCFFFRADIIS